MLCNQEPYAYIISDYFTDEHKHELKFAYRDKSIKLIDSKIHYYKIPYTTWNEGQQIALKIMKDFNKGKLLEEKYFKYEY